MREILFRGKRVDNGEWVVADSFYQCNGKIKLWDSQNRDGYVEVEKETVGQFTSLTDNKNGKKIFEGDILQGSWKTRIIVFFDNDYLQFRAREISSYAVEHSINYYDNGKLEVIGNIHDNKELLEIGE